MGLNLGVGGRGVGGTTEVTRQLSGEKKRSFYPISFLLRNWGFRMIKYI